MKRLNLLQKNSMLQTVKQQRINSISFETEGIKPSLCDYSDAFISVAGDITVTSNNDTDVASKNCAPFCTCKTN